MKKKAVRGLVIKNTSWETNLANRCLRSAFALTCLFLFAGTTLNAASIAGGGYHTLFLKQDGTVWAAGRNHLGQLGDGSTIDKTSPVLIMTGATAVSVGTWHSLFLKADGSAWATGFNEHGRLGDGTTVDKHTPVAIMNDVVAIAAGSAQSFFLKSDGTAWATGFNAYGRLGDGTTTTKLEPVQVLSQVASIAAGSAHTLFLKTDGSVWATGYNRNGTLGNGSNSDVYTPIQVMTGVRKIAAGHGSSFFLKNDDSVWAVGANTHGQLGNGAMENINTPVMVMTGVSDIAVGSFHSLFLRSNGEVYAAGKNNVGQLGDGTTDDTATPKLVISNVEKFYAGWSSGESDAYGGNSFFQLTDHAIWASGANDFGQLGDGSTQGKLTPAKLSIILENLPVPPRGAHIASAIGSEMIVWGGTADITGANASNVGFIYSPATDTWRSISSFGAPGARIFVNSGTTKQHTWTGAELIVWGGTDLMTRFGDGARYKPVGDTWSSIATVNAPEAREHHIMLWTGSEVLVWGGLAANGARLDSGARYNPLTDTWTTMSEVDAPSARDSFNGVWTGTEMIVFGGTSAINTGGRYDPATDTWTSISTDGAPGLQDHIAVWTGTEMIVWGGYNNGLSAVGARYNPATDTWVTLPGSPLSARRRHAAVWTGTEMIVWAGGGDEPTDAGGVESHEAGPGAAYNPTTDSWRMISSVGAPEARLENTAVWTGTEMIVFGGNSGIARVGGTTLSSGGRYNPATDSWLATSETVVSVSSPMITAQPTQQMTKAGDQVTFSVDATLIGPRLATANGQVNNGFLTQVDVLDGGFGYVESPAVNVTDTTGSGAVLTATLSSSGEVSGVTVVNPGSGYSSDPTITIDPPPMPELHYQWKKDGENIPGANARNYVVSSPGSSDIGDYTVLVFVPGSGYVLSEAASLSVNIITMDIADQFIHTGNNVVLAPTIMGVSSPAYQWKKDGLNIANANSATLTLNGVTLLDAGKYSLTITDAFTTQTTAMANLTVSDFSMAPVIRITGKIGDVFRIEKADALLGTSQWNFVKDLTLTESPTAWVDLENPLPDKKFYRVTPLVAQ